jgi:hypothetical protein
MKVARWDAALTSDLQSKQLCLLLLKECDHKQGQAYAIALHCYFDHGAQPPELRNVPLTTAELYLLISTYANNYCWARRSGSCGATVLEIQREREVLTNIPTAPANTC